MYHNFFIHSSVDRYLESSIDIYTLPIDTLWVKPLSRVWLFATPWTVSYHAPLSMGFSRQEYLSGLPFPSPGHLPGPGIKPGSPTLQADALTSEPPGKPRYIIGSCYITQGGQRGALWWLKGRDGGVGEAGNIYIYIYSYCWFELLFCRNNNIVKLLSSN